MEAYIELPVGISRRAKWYKDLFSKFNIEPQKSHFHITAVFFKRISNEESEKLKGLLKVALKGFKEIDLDLGELKILQGKREQYVYLEPFSGPIDSLISSIRACAEKVECDYRNDFVMHITLGTLKEKLEISKVEAEMKAKVSVPAFKIKIGKINLIERKTVHPRLGTWVLPQ